MGIEILVFGEECLSVEHILLVSVAAFLLGVFLTRYVVIHYRHNRQTTQDVLNSKAKSSDSSDDDMTEDEDVCERVKMVLIVRTDLEMTKGKAAAQCCHACLAAFEQSLKTRKTKQLLKAWKMNGQPKITLKCNSEDEMLMLQARAESLGIVAESICDAGRTQIAPGSRTVLALGPGTVEENKNTDNMDKTRFEKEKTSNLTSEVLLEYLDRTSLTKDEIFSLLSLRHDHDHMDLICDIISNYISNSNILISDIHDFFGFIWNNLGYVLSTSETPESQLYRSFVNLFASVYAKYPIELLKYLSEKMEIGDIDRTKFSAFALQFRLHPALLNCQMDPLRDFEVKISSFYNDFAVESSLPDPQITFNDMMLKQTQKEPEKQDENLNLYLLSYQRKCRLLESINSELVSEKSALVQSLNAQSNMYQEYRILKLEWQKQKEAYERLQAELKAVKTKHVDWETHLNTKLRSFRQDRVKMNEEYDKLKKELEESHHTISKLVIERNEATEELMRYRFKDHETLNS